MKIYAVAGNKQSILNKGGSRYFDTWLLPCLINFQYNSVKPAHAPCSKTWKSDTVGRECALGKWVNQHHIAYRYSQLQRDCKSKHQFGRKNGRRTADALMRQFCMCIWSLHGFCTWMKQEPGPVPESEITSTEYLHPGVLWHIQWRPNWKHRITHQCDEENSALWSKHLNTVQVMYVNAIIRKTSLGGESRTDGLLTELCGVAEGVKNKLHTTLRWVGWSTQCEEEKLHHQAVFSF